MSFTDSTPLESKFSTEEALVGLQKELQHSLTSNRTKREEIQQLRVQFDEVKKHLVAKENEIERMELLVRKQEVLYIRYIMILPLTLYELLRNLNLLWEFDILPIFILEFWLYFKTIRTFAFVIYISALPR